MPSVSPTLRRLIFLLLVSAAVPGAGLTAAQASQPEPPTGVYGCTDPVWNSRTGFFEYELKGSVTLKPNGEYSYLDGGEVGAYAYDAQKGEIAFDGGFFGESGAIGRYRPENQQIDIIFFDEQGEEAYDWTCGLND